MDQMETPQKNSQKLLRDGLNLINEIDDHFATQWKRDVKESKNQDKIKEKWQDYCSKNRDMILAYRQKRHQCVCGKSYTKRNKKDHEKSKVHKSFIETLITL